MNSNGQGTPTAVLVAGQGSGTEIVRQGFGGTEIERRNETSSSALAAQARAAIEAAYVMAMQRPRDKDMVRVKLLKDCERPGFAARAYYSIPRKGAKPGRLTKTPGMVEGLSVRFAEAAIRTAGNIRQETRTLYEDDYRRMINVAAIDLESNAHYARDLVIEKTQERRQLKDGDVVLGQRTNSTGDTVYIIQATEADLLVKESALVSRIFRTEALRFVDADIIEECEQQIIATVRKADAADPDAGRKACADAFATLGVMPDALKAYLGHDLGACSPAELQALRGTYQAIRDGETTWADVLAGKGQDAQPSADGMQSQSTRTQATAERIRERKGQQAASAQPASAKAEPEPPFGSPTQATAMPQSKADPTPSETEEEWRKKSDALWQRIDAAGNIDAVLELSPEVMAWPSQGLGSAYGKALRNHLADKRAKFEPAGG